jgi:two-component system sensor histidine kinase HydH
MANLVSSTIADVPIQAPRPSTASGPDGPAAPGGSTAGLSGKERRVEAVPAPDEVVEEPEVTRRLRAQYAEISLLAGGLAHEIRNPLSTVQMNLDLMAEDFQDSETPRDRRVLERIQRLRHEVHRLHGILENFLRFACVQDLKLETVDLNAVVEEICDFYEHHAAAKSIVMRTQLAADLPPIGLDVDLFKQALLNLVLNAEHAMPSGGELILKTRREGRWLVLDVTDTGVGMTEEVRARIFEAFFSTRAAGSGLGLPTTRKIVEAHAGTIHVQSEPGKGSQFTIRLPAGAPPSSPADGLAILDGPSAPRPPGRG